MENMWRKLHGPVLGVLFFAVFSGQQKLGNFKLIEIEFAPVAGAEEYEIEWLLQKEGEGCHTNTKVKASPYTGLVPIECNHFRIRSLAKKEDATAAEETVSAWSELHTIPAMSFNPRKALSKYFRDGTADDKGEKRTFLIGNKLRLEDFTNAKPVFCNVNEGQITLYDKPLVFEKEGRYLVRVFLQDETTKEYRQIQEFLFFTDFTPPTSDLALYPPFYYTDDRYWFSRDTGLIVNGKDTGSGINGYYFRMRHHPSGKEIITVPFVKYPELTFLQNIIRDLQLSQSDELVEFDYFAVDASGNRENIHSLRFHVDATGPEITRIREGVYELKDTSQPVDAEVTSGGTVIFKGNVLDILRLSDEDRKKIRGRVEIKATDKLGNSSQYRGE